eukprot:CAMPEP_0184706978 /NCGR_PEP_ID=MMETSP0313-20130426/37034_1 /TAXON_ID=2792 /ORGANISM="Porphyridium aerugineum, Strain SAG 1380-2" /LENGTH=353 /DNA_ID=CAMNT_0027168547 /DNA_START=596 /DNA_END=1657 /DNA_ORIENTATION=+
MNMNFEFAPDHASSALDINTMNSPVVLGMNMSADILLPLDMASIDNIVSGSSLPLPYGLGSDQELVNSIEFYDLVVKMERLAFEVVKLEQEQKQKLKSVLNDLEPCSTRSSRGVRTSSATSAATVAVSTATTRSSSSSLSNSNEQDMQVQVLIPLDMYLDAIMELVPIVRAFKGILPIADFVEGDITKNVNNARAAGQRLGRSTVQELCIAELSNVPEGEFVMSGSGVEALVWLKRTVQFMQCLMANLVKSADKNNPEYGSVSLTQIVQESYDIIYSPVHPFFLRSIVRLCFNALPSKETFIATLGMSEDAVVCGLERVVRATCMFLHIIVYFFKDLNLNIDDVHNVITLSSP